MKRKMHKTNLLINGMGNSNWIGGLYYKRNIIYSLLSNKQIADRVSITVITEEENVHLFKPLADRISIRTIPHKRQFEYVTRFIIKSILWNIHYVYPQFGKWQRLMPSKGIHWIADFQHNRLPSLFSQEDYDARTRS